MNAATGQKIGIGGAGVNAVGGLSVASSTISGSGVSGVGLSSLNDPGKLLNFNIQGTNGKSSIILTILQFYLHLSFIYSR
jgi:hypothetical protein